MNPDIKKLWVEALRSGKYRQGHNALRRGNQYCCLGVLCDLAMKHASIGEWQKRQDIGPSSPYIAARNYSFLGRGGFPNKRVLDWAGAPREEDGSYPSFKTLSIMNDGSIDTLPHSFSQIADYIEANL